ncbi:MAG: hypothetical protein K8T90_18885 [Planctomycetes bacterium]|nr:hypothetical protein [Planctomycetota bacterium]
MEQALCRICQSPFDVASGAAGPPVCPSCKSLSAQVGQMAPNEVQIHPATGTIEDFAGQLNAAPRPKPVLNKRVGVRAGPVAAVAGLVIGIAGLAVVKLSGHEPDRAKEIVGPTRAEECTIEVAPSDDFVARHVTTLRLKLVREEPRVFGGTADRRLDVAQATTQSSEAALVRLDRGAATFDMTSEGQVVSQTGKSGSDDARDTVMYPWSGRHPQVRVRATSTAPLSQLDGSAVTAGYDVQPFFHLGALSAQTRSFRVGDRWKADISMPCLADRQGRVFTWTFPAEITYAGTAVRAGYKCAAFRVTAQAPQRYPAAVDDAFNHSSVKIAGAVWIELTTGVSAGADLVFDAHLWKDAGRIEDDYTIAGRLTQDRE